MNGHSIQTDWVSALETPSSKSKPEGLQTLQSLSDVQRSAFDRLISILSAPDYELPRSLEDFHRANNQRHSNTSAQKRTSSLRSLTPSSRTSSKLVEAASGAGGVSEGLSEKERCFCTRECLLRICRSTRWDFDRALSRLEETLVWRREFAIDAIDLDVIRKEAETGKQFILGYDIHSRPCLYMFPSRQNTRPSKDQIKFVVWCLERTIDLMPVGVEALTLLIDFGSSDSVSSGPRLGRAICINVPWIFWGFHKLVKPFLDPHTATKIQFDPVMKDLIPAEQLQKPSFGGELEFEYDNQAYLPKLIALAEKRQQEILERYRRLGQGRIGISESELKAKLQGVEQMSDEVAPQKHQNGLDAKKISDQTEVKYTFVKDTAQNEDVEPGGDLAGRNKQKAETVSSGSILEPTKQGNLGEAKVEEVVTEAPAEEGFENESGDTDEHIRSTDSPDNYDFSQEQNKLVRPGATPEPTQKPRLESPTLETEEPGHDESLTNLGTTGTGEKKKKTLKTMKVVKMLEKLNPNAIRRSSLNHQPGEIDSIKVEDNGSSRKLSLFSR